MRTHAPLMWAFLCAVTLAARVPWRNVRVCSLSTSSVAMLPSWAVSFKRVARREAHTFALAINLLARDTTGATAGAQTSCHGRLRHMPGVPC
mmetsp:Transcript_39973/g.105651  ORF Transcript_39973/g.105651 Transcript_39973/m.105651 type:complete len:92 (-) Transcript_39973:1076-1351(-)